MTSAYLSDIFVSGAIAKPVDDTKLHVINTGLVGRSAMTHVCLF